MYVYKSITIFYRFLLFTYGTLIFLNLQKDDKFYTTIPLYHTAGGVLGVGSALVLGNPIVIRKKFSASAYFADCAKYKCTVSTINFIFIKFC